MNFFHHKDLGNHLLQLCPKVVKHPVYIASGAGVGPGSGFAGVCASALNVKLGGRLRVVAVALNSEQSSLYPWYVRLSGGTQSFGTTWRREKGVSDLCRKNRINTCRIKEFRLPEYF